MTLFSYRCYYTVYYTVISPFKKPCKTPVEAGAGFGCEMVVRA